MAGDLEVIDGRIQMSDPMHMFHMDQDFAYNGEVRIIHTKKYSFFYHHLSQYFDRSIMMGHFITSKRVNEGKVSM